jgi:hypothetical protein
MSERYRVKHRDGSYLARRVSAVFDGGPWRWSSLRARSHTFDRREEAESIAAALRQEDGECGAELEPADE